MDLRVLLCAHNLSAAAIAAVLLRCVWLSLRCDSFLIRCGGCGEGKLVLHAINCSLLANAPRASETRLALGDRHSRRGHESTTPRAFPCYSSSFVSHHICITCSSRDQLESTPATTPHQPPATTSPPAVLSLPCYIHLHLHLHILALHLFCSSESVCQSHLG